jgi:hypothetical protein
MGTFIYVLQVVAMVVGVAMMLFGIFAGATDPGKVQSYVLNFWVKVVPFGEKATSRHEKLVRGSAVVALRAFDWLFGSKIVSPRCIWTALCLSFTSLYLVIMTGLGVVTLGVAHRDAWVPPTAFDNLKKYASGYPVLFYHYCRSLIAAREAAWA